MKKIVGYYKFGKDNSKCQDIELDEKLYEYFYKMINTPWSHFAGTLTKVEE